MPQKRVEGWWSLVWPWGLIVVGGALFAAMMFLHDDPTQFGLAWAIPMLSVFAGFVGLDHRAKMKRISGR